MIKNNTDVKNSLSFILDAFQTRFLCSTRLEQQHWKQKHRNTHGGPAGPQDAYSSVTVSRIKAQVCTSQGH